VVAKVIAKVPSAFGATSNTCLLSGVCIAVSSVKQLIRVVGCQRWASRTKVLSQLRVSGTESGGIGAASATITNGLGANTHQ